MAFQKIILTSFFNLNNYANPKKINPRSKIQSKKNLKFFEDPCKFPCFDMLKNGGRGSKKSFEIQVVRVPKRVHESQQLRCGNSCT